MNGIWTVSWIVARVVAAAQGLTLVALTCTLGRIYLKATGAASGGVRTGER